VSSRQWYSGFTAYISCTFDYPAGHFCGKFFQGPAKNGYGHQRPAAHGINIADGVCGGNASEIVGIIHDGGEEIDGEDDAGLGVDAQDSRIVVGVEPDDQSLVDGEVNPGKQLLEVTRTQLSRSTGGLCPTGETDFFRVRHGNL